jgi:hypothetical protein
MKPFRTEDFVRRIIRTALRSGAWRGRALCVLCLEKLAVEGLGQTFRRTDVHAALDAIREKPGALVFLPTFSCAKCEKKEPCLSASPRPRSSAR